MDETLKCEKCKKEVTELTTFFIYDPLRESKAMCDECCKEYEHKNKDYLKYIELESKTQEAA